MLKILCRSLFFVGKWRYFYRTKPNEKYYHMKIKVDNLPVYLTLCLFISVLYSCVPAKQFEDVKKRETSCREENAKLTENNQNLTTDNTELRSTLTELQKRVDGLKKDTTELGNSIQRSTALYAELMKSYDRLMVNNEKLLAGNTEETKKLILQLNKAQEDLQRKSDQIKKDSTALRDKQARVEELESVLRKNDSTMAQLKNTVSAALLGYANSGLTVHERDGQVYVSMEESLLFASGSTVVEKKGESALKDLSKVLATNKDISILVEGHTDNVPISGTLPSGAKDNWELSVLRATSVVKIILADKAVDPTRLTATGRGSFSPVDASGTVEARKKNRRTEIILSPKLDELRKVLGY